MHGLALLQPEMKDSRHVCVSAADGQTGYLIAELLLTGDDFKDKVDSVTVLTLHPSAAKIKELHKLGAKVVAHKPGRLREVTQVLKDSGCDTICLIPPTHVDKFDITLEAITAAKQSGTVQNVCFISSAGCDVAERDRQPRLREFVDLETEVMNTKGDTSTPLGHSPVIIRAGFYAENLLLYAPNAQNDGTLPLPIGKNHKFAPVALGDIAQVAAHILVGRGQHGFDDAHRGQLLTLTGPMMCAGAELASAASEALGVDMQFEDISAREAKRVLHLQAGQHDNSEKEYLLEYYSLVKEGKTNYIATHAFSYITGSQPQHPVEFFKTYAEEFKGDDGPSKKKRKTEKE